MAGTISSTLVSRASAGPLGALQNLQLGSQIAILLPVAWRSLSSVSSLGELLPGHWMGCRAVRSGPGMWLSGAGTKS